MQVKQAKPEDLAEYVEMDLETEYDYVADVFTDVAAKGHLYSATLGGRMVGVAMLRKVDPDHAYLGLARVDRRYRNQGVVSRLSEELIDRARQQGLAWVGLCTNAENAPARRVAEKLGLQIIGRHLSCNFHGPYSNNEHPLSPVRHKMSEQEKTQRLAEAYEQTGVLPRSPYAMIPWPRTAMQLDYVKTLVPVELSCAGDRIKAFINTLAEPQLHLLLLKPAIQVSKRTLSALAQLTHFEATHLEFPVQHEEDWRELPSLPAHWYVNRYVVYGIHLCGTGSQQDDT